MINYRSHTVEELATDEMFRRWVIAPTPEISLFWNQWIKENPDRQRVVSGARKLVISVHEIHLDNISEEMVRRETDEISRLAELRKQTEENSMLYWPAVWRVAAAFVLVSGLSMLYFLTRNNVVPRLPLAIDVPKSEEMYVRSNQSLQEMTVLLSDSSVATLSKGSTITFPKTFAAKERRVYLTGEGFFDVTKNPDQPFLVYTNETVTKVLGTSFRVKAFDQENTVLVVVKTGRVSVYPKKEYETKAGQRAGEMKHVVLDPNQQAIFIRNENRLEKGMVAYPQMLSESIVPKDQIFDDKPVTEVFKSLEKVYGIEIVFNAETLSNCSISTQFGDESLKQRLNAICEAIDATYEIAGGQIVISSKGCN